MFLMGHNFVSGLLCIVKRPTRSLAIAVTADHTACRSTIG